MHSPLNAGKCNVHLPETFMPCICMARCIISVNEYHLIQGEGKNEKNKYTCSTYFMCIISVW